jgi:hypothetical protein
MTNHPFSFRFSLSHGSYRLTHMSTTAAFSQVYLIEQQWQHLSAPHGDLLVYTCPRCRRQNAARSRCWKARTVANPHSGSAKRYVSTYRIRFSTKHTDPAVSRRIRQRLSYWMFATRNLQWGAATSPFQPSSNEWLSRRILRVLSSSGYIPA